MTDNNGYVLAPLPVAPVNETDMVLLPKSLNALKQVAQEVGLDLRGAYVNLDGGFDSRANRKCIFNAGMIPNIKENPRNRKRPKRGRKRWFNAALHALRMRVERTFAWEDKCSATRQDWSKGIGGGDAFMKLCSSSSGCKTRPAKGEPA
jgi:Transposase DDE domain